MKPGWKTTEFWKNLGLLLGALATVATTLLVACGRISITDADTITKSVGIIAMAVVSVGMALASGKSNAGYSASRADVKKAESLK